jgi:hypothetical protein
MGLLLSWIRRHLCCCQAGVVALIAMVLPLLMCRRLCSPGIFAIVAILLLPLLLWCCCHLQAGAVALITMASSPSSMHRRLCHCHNGILALVALAPLPILQEHCHPCCICVVVLIALTPLPSRCMGIITVIALVLLPPSTWCVCAVALVSLPLSCWHCHPQYAGIIAFVMQASLPLLCLHCAVDLQVSLPSLSWHVLSCGRHGRPCQRQRQHQCNNVNNSSTTRVATPA